MLDLNFEYEAYRVHRLIADGPADAIITFYSSGTTGEPKRHDLSVRDVRQRSRSGNHSLEDIILCYEPWRWAGVSVLAYAARNFCYPIVPRSLAPKDILEKIDQAPRISFTPTMFRQLCIAGLVTCSDMRQVTFGGEYVDQGTLDKARRVFPHARISHVYASSEHGDICAVSDGKEGYPEEKFKYSSPGDIWELRDGRYYFTGRVDNVINVGGAKVNLEYVESKLVSGLGLVDGRAYRILNTVTGAVVGFEYVGNPWPLDVKEFAKRTLHASMNPVVIQQVSEIALSQAGKKIR